MYIISEKLFVKVIGKGGKKIYVKTYDEFVQAIGELQKESKPLTFAFELPFENHCTISYINYCNKHNFYSVSKNFFDTIQCEPFIQFKVKNKTTFGKTNVLILEIESNTLFDAFQQMSQIGKQEGPSIIRTHHMSYFLDGPSDKIKWIQNILSNLN